MLSSVLAAMVGLLPGEVHAASGDIVVVTDRPDLEQGAANIAGYLRSLGYAVATDPGTSPTGPSDYRILDSTKIAFLETFDLVFVLRTVNSGDFANGSEASQWNGLNVPLLLGSAYLARNNPARWNWLAGSQTRATVTGLTFVDPAHPIVNGLNTDLFNLPVDVDSVSASSPGNGVLVANVNNAGAAIVVWEGSGFFMGAAGESHAHRRVFFPTMRYYETDLSLYPGVFSDYSPNGLQLLANAVAYAMNGTVSNAPLIRDLSPADGTVSHPATSGITFRITSTQAVPDSGIVLLLNGADVSNELLLGGIPTDRMVSFGGLGPDTAYSGSITVSNALGTRTLDFSFDTFPADETAPTVVVIDPAPGVASSVTSITVTFSEPVDGVAASDLSLNGGPANSVSGSGAIYTFEFDSPLYGTVNMAWDPSAQIRDVSPLQNLFDPMGPGTTWQYDYRDAAPPVVTATSPFPGATVRVLTQVSLTFDEEVTGVDAADLLMNGVAALTVSGVLAGPYVFNFDAPQAGLVEMEWGSGHGIEDTAVPGNAFQGGSWSYSLDPDVSLPDVRINEILAATLSTNQLKDEDGDLQDWVEILNHGSVAVNLAGWSLTDDEDDPDRWVFPQLELGPGEYLVVFASGKDRKTGTLHANFQLRSAGEFLGLYNADLPPAPVSVLRYPEQRADISYGYDPSDAFRYFATPTPGTVNGDSTLAGAVPAVRFNVGRGLFDAPFTLHLTVAEPGAQIRYTIDGSEPSLSNGTTYEGAMEVAATTVMRAAAFKTNRLPSVAVTHTYLFLEQALTQPNTPPGFPSTWGTASSGFPTPDVPADYEMDPEIVQDPVYAPRMLDAMKSLPSVSIVMDQDALFGPENGIYSHVTENQSLYRGVAWERACSMEFLPTNGRGGFQVDCGIRMQGNASREPRKNPKHPFRLLFKGAYGPGRLQEEVFPDSPVKSFNTLVMRSDFNNSWLHWDANQRLRGTRIRDAWVKDSWREMGHPSSHSRYFHLFLNGLYWGIYDFGERVDASFAANYLGGVQEDYEAIASKPVKAVDGDTVAFTAMRSTVTGRDQSVLANYEAAMEVLDMESHADYMLLNFYGANQDWGNDSNWNMVRRRSPAGKFKMAAWDGEQLLVSSTENRVTNPSVPAGLHTSLLNSPEYRLLFADRVHRHLFNGGALTVDRVTDRWLKRADEVRLAILAESARWGDYRRDVHQHSSSPYLFYTPEGFWEPEIERIATAYFPQRHNIFLTQLRAAGLYPSVDAPSFSQHGGAVPPGFSLALSAADPIYFTTDGSDPREFGTGNVASGAVLYTGAIPLGASVQIKARARSGAAWSALDQAEFTVFGLTSPIRITEIMYNPVGGDPYEFIELRNTSIRPQSIGGFYLSGVGFIFSTEAVLAPGQTILLANGTSSAAFANRYPGVVVYGYFSGNLANGGERLTLHGPDGRNVTSVDYDDGNGWPTRADGFGSSLESIDANGDPNDPANWRASLAANGSPGTVEDPPPLPSLRLNEIMADNLDAVENGGLFPDWVELHNSGASPVDIGDWSLSDRDDPRRFVFPSGTVLPEGGYLIVWCDTNSTAPGLHSGFGLNRGGESLFLYDSGTNRVDAVTFGGQVSNYTVGRIGGQWTLCTPTPGMLNQAAALGAGSSLVINEWMANPASGEDDWLELYNPANAPVALRGLYLANQLTTYQIASLSFIAPLSFARLWADEAGGQDHLDFKLPASGGTIALSSRDGSSLDSVSYGPQADGVSEGRLPDGAASIVPFPGTPSPGAANYADVYTGPRLNEVLARNVSALAGPKSGYADWIELYRDLGAPADLSGMRLSDDPGQPDKWIIPAGVQISDFLLIWCDGSRPASTAVEPNLNTGFSLSGQSGGVYLFNATGRLVDRVDYGLQIADQSIGLTGAEWRLLASPTPGAPNASGATLGAPGGLRINEWMAQPANEDDWLELFNAGSLPVNLEGLVLTDDLSLSGRLAPAIGSLTFIGAKGHARFQADGAPSNGRHHLAFSLNGSGEAIRLYDLDGSIIDNVFLGRQIEGVSEGRFPDGAAGQVRFDSTPTPAASNFLPLPDVTVSEVLSHSEVPLEDAVELRNLSATAVDVSGWYLSDSEKLLKKYRIPAGTLVPAGGYRVFYQYQLEGGTGSLVPFAFNSARGGRLILSQAGGADELTGYRSMIEFGAAERGVSFGRYETSLGPRYPAMSQRTFGADQPADLTQFRSGAGLLNAPPLVGPIILNEVMYHPESSGNEDEFIELHNVSPAPLDLFDVDYPENRYRVRGGVSYDFPAGAQLSGRGYLLIVRFDPDDPAAAAAFRATYSLPPDYPLFGPFQGKLGDDGDQLRLLKPDAPQGAGADQGFVPYILVDELEYGDLAPWPAEADGAGDSLQRRRPYEFGNDPVNWKAGDPTPGRANVIGAGLVDTDRDGVPDNYESVHGLDPNDPGDVLFDADLDGASSLREFHEGTDPANPASVLVRPFIIQQPLDQSAQPDESVTFAASAGGTPPLEYQWWLNGRALPGANAPLLELDYIGRADRGIYTLVVRNGAGFAISSPATLEVNIPPRITQQPLGGDLLDTGSEFVLMVGATGSGVVRYQWLHNGVAIFGAEEPVLILSNLQGRDSGTYAVRVTDDSASILSDTVLLTVASRPVVLVPPFSQTVAVGDTVTFSIQCDGTLPMYYRWRRGGLTLTINEAFAWEDYYTITNVQLSDAGSYNVVLTNAAFSTPGTISLPAAVLTVLEDSDQDGLPDTVETDNGFNPNDPADGLLDRDGDLVSNRDEYRSGTDFNDPASYLKVESVELSGVAIIRFQAVAGHTYSVIYQDGVGLPWIWLQDVPAPSLSGEVQVLDATASGVDQRFYRLLTPRSEGR